MGISDHSGEKKNGQAETHPAESVMSRFSHIQDAHRVQRDCQTEVWVPRALLPRGGPGWCWCGSSTGRWLMAGWTLRMEDTNPSCHCIVSSVPCTATVASPHPGELAHKWQTPCQRWQQWQCLVFHLPALQTSQGQKMQAQSYPAAITCLCFQAALICQHHA